MDAMNTDTIAKLTDINYRFYQNFSGAFAATRRRIQPGVRRILNGLPEQGDWLDLGCGSGALAQAWSQSGRSGLYWGLDFSAGLLDEARQAQVKPDGGLVVRFDQANLSDEGWPALLGERRFEGILAFAALHHLPSRALRLRVLRQVRGLLVDGGTFIHSEWQFQHSEKLMARRQPWEAASLTEADVEPGDTLLDWRYALPGQREHSALRYVHLFDREELAGLAAGSGFELVDEFESDGEGGRLGLYQVWRGK